MQTEALLAGMQEELSSGANGQNRLRGGNFEEQNELHFRDSLRGLWYLREEMPV